MSKEFYNAAVFGDVAALVSMAGSNPAIVHWTDQYGFTALHGAAGEENFLVVDTLLNLGANVNAPTHDGITPLHVAVYPRMANYLIERGADVEAPRQNGDTPLITFAAEGECLDVMKVLLKRGANPNSKNKHGQTAMMIAISRQEHKKVKLLKKYGAVS